MNVETSKTGPLAGRGLFVTHALVGLVTSGLVMAQPAVAQDSAVSDNAAALGVEEIVVTASRREQVLQDAPASVVSIAPDEFKAIGLTTLRDVIEYTPGITYRDEGAPGQGSISARGVPQASSIPVVGVYLDDVPFSTNSSFARGGISLFDGLLGDVERVEVIKGPQGTLYGAVAVGGLVKYISRDPALDEFRASAGVNLSSTASGGFNQLYNGRISVPVVDDTLGVTVSGFYEDRDGYLDVVDPASGATIHDDANTSERYGVTLDALYQPTDRASLEFKFLRHETDYPLDAVAALAGPDSDAAAFGEFTTVFQPGENTIEYTNFAATLEYEFDWATLTAVSSRVEYDLLNVTDATAGLALGVDFVLGRPFGTTTFVGSERVSTSEKFVQELRLTSPQSDTLEWILGFYHADEETTQSQDIQALPAPDAVLGFADFPSEYEEFAVFGDVTYYFTPKLDVTVGMRVSSNETRLSLVQDGVLVGLIDPEVLVFDVIDDTVETYLFALRYRPSETASLYARIASGYRPASGNIPTPNPFGGPDLAGPVLASDSIWSYELGVKGSLADRLLTYELALWQSDWEDFQTIVSAFGANASTNYDGTLESRGFEGMLGLRPSDGLSLSASVAYTDSEVSDDDPFLGAVAGEPHPNVPEWTASAQASYSFRLTSAIDASVGGGMRYVGESVSAFSQSTSSVPVEVDAYTLVDLNAGLSFGSVSGSLYVTNLFDEVELQNRSDIIVAPGVTESFGVFTPPRTIGVSVQVDF